MSLVPTREEVPQIMRSAGPGPRRPAYRPATSSGAGFSITGKDVLRILRRRKWLILISLIVFTTTSIVSTYLWLQFAPSYTAQAFLMVNPPKSSEIRGERGFLSENIMNRLMMTYAQAAASEKIFSDTVGDIRNTQWYAQAIEGDRDVIPELFREVSITPVPKTNLLRVAMTGQNRNDITQIVNAVAKAAVEDTVQDSQATYADIIDRLQVEREQLDKIREENVRKVRTMLQRGIGGQAVEAAATVQYQQQALIAKMTETNELYVAAKTALETVQGLTDEELAQQPEVQQLIQMNPELQILRNQVLGLEVQLAGTQKRFGGDHKTIRRLQHALDSAQEILQRKKQEVIRKSIQQLKNIRQGEFMKLEEMYLMLREQIQIMDEKLKTLESQQATLQQAKEEKRGAEEKLGVIDTRLMDLRMLRRGERPLVVHRQATLPRSPSRPKYTIMVPAGVLLGLVFGVGLAFLLEFLDTSIKAPSDVSRRVELPLLGMIPHLDDVEEEIDDLRTCFLDRPDTLIGEAFRQARTTLVFSGPAEQRRSILITSAMPEDGRTSVALNLAHAVAGGGGKVLVIDANFRQPMIRKLFPGCPEGGLSTVLVGQADWRTLLHAIEPNLHVLASGPIPPNPAELLGSDAARKLITELYDEFDMVLFDSSPCLVVTDAVALSTMVDGAILVVRAGVNTYGIVQRARDMFNHLGTHLFGVILNGVRVTAGGYLRKNYETFYEYREAAQLPAGVAAAEPEPEAAPPKPSEET